MSQKKTLSILTYFLLPSVFYGQQIASVDMIWDQGSHNAFTDLVRFDSKFYCVFQVASDHMWVADAFVEVISSSDGDEWARVSTVASPDTHMPDIRDPKLTVTPDGQLMLTAGVVALDGSRYRTLAWFSSDGV